MTSSDLKFPLVESSSADDDVIQISPWKIYQFHPEYLSKHLSTKQNEIVPDKHLYMMMSSNGEDNLRGNLDKFCNMWIIKCENKEDVVLFLEKLEAGWSILNVVLIERNIFTNTIEIPMVIFVNNRSKEIESLKTNLKMVLEAGNTSKYFSFEVDFGLAVESWALKILKRDFICVGGRFCVTNGASFNHVLDWNNILSCLPCLPCCLVAGSVYRVKRKIRYLETVQTANNDVMLVGSESCDEDEQRTTLIKLMNWATEGSQPISKKTEQDTTQVNDSIEEQHRVIDTVIIEEQHRVIDAVIIKEQHRVIDAVIEEQASQLPLVDSSSVYKRRCYDPLTYPALVNFLASGKVSKNPKKETSVKVATNELKTTGHPMRGITEVQESKQINKKIVLVKGVTAESTV